MVSPILLFTAQIIAVLSVVLIAVGYLKTEPRAASARVFALMILFVVFYLLNGMSAEYIDPQFRLDVSRFDLIIDFGLNSISGLFMIYCYLIFQDEQRFPRMLAVLLAIQVGVDFLLSLVGSINSGGESLLSPVPSVDFLLDVMQLLFIGLGLYWTMKGWRSDLVQDRRALRWFIIGAQGWLIFLVFVTENFLLNNLINDRQSPMYILAQTVIACSIAVIAFGTLMAAMRFDYVSLRKVIKKVVELTEEPEEESSNVFDIDTFDKKFNVGKLYREAGLTIAVLAKKLSVPEYKLRSFIHKELGYRNFNAMLHKYRVDDASVALSDPSKKGVPILTIALSVGYQSITPFNNAFRNIKGVTPSEYRKKELQ